MADITICDTAQNPGGGNALRLTVRGCEVLALFEPEKNTGVYHSIRRTLLDSCLDTYSANKNEKIGQKEQNMR